MQIFPLPTAPASAALILKLGTAQPTMGRNLFRPLRASNEPLPESSMPRGTRSQVAQADWRTSLYLAGVLILA